MTIPRSQQIDIQTTPFYHVMNRCVRRSFLCGFDESTQTDYTHRKAWIVNRIKLLADIFAINICAFAIMSNHYHVVLHVDDEKSKKWPSDEVIERWGSLFPKDAKENKHLPFKIKLWRERLVSVSWFMRCLNERIARAVNEEDEVSGRFWEGRFKSQALLDEGALLSAMAYVDLNPTRAGIAKTPETSDFTSIQERIHCIVKEMKTKNRHNAKSLKNLPQPGCLMPFFNKEIKASVKTIDFQLSDYLELVDSTGRIIRDDKLAGSIPSHLHPILERLSLTPESWVCMVKNITRNFAHAVGGEIVLLNFGKKCNRKPKGIRFAQKTYKSFAG